MPTNKDGSHVRILVGSKIITEGLNFTAVNHQLVMSFPPNIPTLIQIFGRVVRRGSHMILPLEQRWVNIKIYVSYYGEDNLELELAKCYKKSHGLRLNSTR